MPTRNKPSVADICLYGTREIGAGYIARATDGRMFGTGEPERGASMTDAMWNAAEDLRDAGITGPVRVFAPGGQIQAEFDTTRFPIPYFGSLEWRPAGYFEIPVEAILAAAEQD